MTKTETRKLQTRFSQLHITRKTKTPEYRLIKGLLLMGAISEMRGQEKLFREGNDVAQLFADYAQLRRLHLTHQLRKV